MLQTLWRPSAGFAEKSHLTHYMQWLGEHYALHFNDYHSLWQWSVDEVEVFWESLFRYFRIQSHTPYTQILSQQHMPGAKWFVGAQVNYAEHIFRQQIPTTTALLFRREDGLRISVNWQELRHATAQFRAQLRALGLQPGERVAAYLPNIPQAAVGFLACASLGGVWSSVSPDFGVSSVIDRFCQIEPRVLIVVDGYRYGGKVFDRRAAILEIAAALPSVQQVIVVPYLGLYGPNELPLHWQYWEMDTSDRGHELSFAPTEFNDPIWVLYSSGTTGLPKAITHSQGGVLLEHLKYLSFHNNVQPGERFFWFSTTGWMMWNYSIAAWLSGACVVLYDGSPGYPDLSVLWQLAAEERINHFGTSAPFLVACMKAGIVPREAFDLSALVSIGSTGSPLPPEGFDYVYQQIKPDLWLCSISGGTDVCSAFVGGNPLLPVVAGEIQCRALGCALAAWDENGESLLNQVGEMVITRPMPSMPIGFWNDADGTRYSASYFEHFPGVWRHGDWIRVSERGSVVIYGRSDATLNRQGVRIGTAELYSALDKLPEIVDALVVNLELPGGNDYMPLFVKLAPQHLLNDTLLKKIKDTLRIHCSPRHVPDVVVAIDDIPYTISGKKMETPVKRILLGAAPEKVVSKDSMRNPAAMQYFVENATKLRP